MDIQSLEKETETTNKMKLITESSFQRNLSLLQLCISFEIILAKLKGHLYGCLTA